MKHVARIYLPMNLDKTAISKRAGLALYSVIQLFVFAAL